MVKVAQVAAYETSDGKLFVKESEAVSHEAELKLEITFDQGATFKRPILGGPFEEEFLMDFESVVKWVRANANEVRCLLGVR